MRKKFDLIWEQQAKHHPDLLTDGLKKKLRDDTIFMQRPLKSAKHLVGKCTFEPAKRAAPISSPLFQEFRIWQTLANVKVLAPGDLNYRFLTLDEKQTLAQALKFKEKLSEKDIKKFLKLEGREVRFNDIKGFGKGNRTLAALAKAVGEEHVKLFSHDDYARLWHTLYSSSTSREEFEQHLVLRHNLTQAQATAVAGIQVEEGYGSLSSKAIGKILPHMQEGMNYAEAAKAAGYHHSLRDIDDSTRDLDDRLQLDPKQWQNQKCKKARSWPKPSLRPIGWSTI